MITNIYFQFILNLFVGINIGFFFGEEVKEYLRDLIW